MRIVDLWLLGQRKITCGVRVLQRWARVRLDVGGGNFGNFNDRWG